MEEETPFYVVWVDGKLVKRKTSEYTLEAYFEACEGERPDVVKRTIEEYRETVNKLSPYAEKASKRHSLVVDGVIAYIKELENK